MKRPFLTFLLAISVITLKAQQSVSIGTTTVNNKAVLFLSSPGGNQGLIIPVVSNKSAVGAATNEKGMIVFDDSDKKLYCHNGSGWVEVSTGTGSGGTYTMVLSGTSIQLMNGATVASTVPLGNDFLNTAGTLTVNGLKGKTIPALPVTTQALVYNGTAWVFQPISAGTGDITSVNTNAGSGLTGGATTGDATLSLTNTGVIANTYGSATTIPQVTVDVQGRITNAQNIALADGSATNEIQNLALAGAAGSATPGEVFNVNISGGTGVTITEGSNVDITRSGTNLTIGASLTGVAGGDLTGTYPNPTIANGAISGGTGGEITDNTITNADIFTGAAIAGTKIAPNFGTQAVQTTGTLSSGAITTTNLASVNTVPYTWPNTQGAASSVLTNNGAGVLSWAPSSTFTTTDVIPKGSATGLTASQMMANATGVGINTTNPGTELQIDGFTPTIRMRSTQSTTLSQSFVEFGHDDGSGGFINVGSIGDVGSSDGLRLFSPYQIDFNVNFGSRFNLGPQGQVGVGNPLSYGNSGQVLTSQGGSAEAEWRSIFSGANEVPRGDGNGFVSSNIYSDGTSVGIGAASGGYLLDVNKASASSIDTQIRTFNPANAASVKSGIRFQTGSGWAVQLQTSQGDNWLELTNNGGTPYHHWTYDSYYPGNLNVGYLQGTSSGLALMGGNVGVGKTNPESSAIIDAVGGDFHLEDSYPFLNLNTTSTSSNSGINFREVGASKGWVYYNGLNDEIYLSNTSGGGVPHMTIDISGRVGMSRSAATNVLEVEGNASKTVAGSWLANSDRRIKTDFQEIDGIETLKKLHPLKFKYTEEWKKQHPLIEDKYYYNFIAQEFQQVFPDAVKGSGEYIEGDPKEVLQIDTYNAEIVTIKAVQELIQRVEQLEKENAQLKSEKQNLENEMKAEIAEIKRMLGTEAKASPSKKTN
jgi:hypothetical protein